MAFYRNVLLPRLCHLSMHNRRLLPYRKRAIGLAEGRVLEIGVGSGLNLPLYGQGVREILALDPDQQLIAMARKLEDASGVPVRFIESSAEAVPIDDNSIDTIVTTWTLCTIPSALRTIYGRSPVCKARCFAVVEQVTIAAIYPAFSRGTAVPVALMESAG